MRGSEMTNLKPETYYWDFGDSAEPRTSTSSDASLWVKYPQEGGSKTITLKTGMSNDECMDSIAFDLFVPAIGDRDTVICRYISPDGGNTTILGHTFREPIDTILHTKTLAGCDSAVHVIIDYEAMSNVEDAPISEKKNIEIYGNKVLNPDAYLIVIYDVTGKVLYKGKDEEIVIPTHGIYILQMDGAIYKVIL